MELSFCCLNGKLIGHGNWCVDVGVVMTDFGWMILEDCKCTWKLENIWEVRVWEKRKWKWNWRSDVMVTDAFILQRVVCDFDFWNDFLNYFGMTQNHLHIVGDFQTPLHRATTKGHIEVVKLLIEHGADINMKDVSNHDMIWMRMIVIEQMCDFWKLIEIGCKYIWEWLFYFILLRQKLINFLSELCQ